MTSSNDNSDTSSLESRLIESDEFPFEFVSTIAERESWRKEIYRPIYHTHKWWAKRLGSVFRGMLLGCLLPEGVDLSEAFYQRHDFPGTTVFDPFMGSGTTIGEAHKLGCISLGRDINPVACESVRIALGPMDILELSDAFSHLSATVGIRIRELYKATDKRSRPSDVLYYFWVKYVSCPHCNASVDLFSSRIIARNAYPNRKPEVQLCCPNCGDIFPCINSTKIACCPSCELEFNPHEGSAMGTQATCSACSRSFPVVNAVRVSDEPPKHRLYGKLLLTPEGYKQYLPATTDDFNSYEESSRLLSRELKQGAILLPTSVLEEGFNTRQAIGYNYRAWRDFFNDRQLLALGWLQGAITELPSSAAREAILVLFSGVLEFNNLFASYKGEGTGAVRHMFSHHILKPERMPIEANVWGTPKSSGSFLNLFKTRLLRALNYRTSPFEITNDRTRRTRVCSVPFSGEVDITWPIEGNLKPRGIYLSCGSSDKTGLQEGSVDFVITDPPFFDNVHYSELADFFHSWQRIYPHGFIDSSPTTRNTLEVQDTNADKFAEKLSNVFTECYRVLKEDGLLVFTYHHSRSEGWTSLLKAVCGSGFTIINAHPVKAEMSVATPKSQAKEPIQLDIILVCRKREYDTRTPPSPSDVMASAAIGAQRKLVRLASVGLKLSRNDLRVVAFSQFISMLGPLASVEEAVDALLSQETRLDELVESLSYERTLEIAKAAPVNFKQMSMF